MPQEPFVTEAEVELFDRPGGWYYVAVPAGFSEELADLADRGLIPVRATVGTCSWNTSLLPVGDGSHFIALKAELRKSEGLDVDDEITVAFVPREP